MDQVDATVKKKFLGQTRDNKCTGMSTLIPGEQEKKNKRKKEKKKTLALSSEQNDQDLYHCY